MDPERELDVLAGEAAGEPSQLLEHVPPPDLERPDGAEHEVEPRPRDPVVEERAQVVEMLVCEQRPALDGSVSGGRGGRAPGALRDREVAGDAQDPSRVREDEPHSAQQRVGEEDRVGVDAAHVAEAGGVDPRVQGVGLPAVLLVDHQQPGMRGALVVPADATRLDEEAREPLCRLEREVLTQPLERAVRRAVVDDDHLELGVVLRQERADRRGDAGLLVERCEDHRHRDREAGARDRPVVLGRALEAADDCSRTARPRSAPRMRRTRAGGTRRRRAP